MNKINLIDELTKNTYEVALFTSYSTDLLFFEKMIVRHLIEQDCTYIGLFVDQSRLYEAISKPNISELGRSYLIKGVEASQAFHPKVFLLLGEKKAKLIVGSGNITPAGFITNYEVFNVFDYDLEGDQAGNLMKIQEGFRFFQSLASNEDNASWQKLFQKAKEYAYLYADEEPDLGQKFLTNDVVSLHEQLDSLLPQNIERIECFSPYFDRSLSLLKTWNDLYKPGEIKVFLQNHHTNFPRGMRLDSNVSLYEARFKEDEDKRYHGKVFRFIGAEEEVIVYGSGNCSRQAFLHSFHDDGGNAEAVIVEKAGRSSFDEFFEEAVELSLLPVPLPDEFKTMELVDDEKEEAEGQKIQFLDGIVQNNELYIIVKSTSEIKWLVFENKEGKLKERAGDFYTFVFHEVNADQLGPIIELEAYLDTRCIPVLGWCHHEEVLQYTFSNINNSIHSKLENDPYLEDYHNLVDLLDDLQQRLILNEEDISESTGIKNRLHSMHQQAELNEEISTNPDDYYVDDAHVTHVYGSHGGVDVIGNLIRMMLRGFQGEAAASVEITQETPPRDSSTQAEELPEDLRNKLQKKMRRFRSKFHQGVSSQHYLDNIDSDAMIKNIIIYSGFLFKLQHKLGEAFLNRSELIEECMDLVQAVDFFSEENILDISREDVQMLVIQVLATIYARERDISEKEENYHMLRNEKKKLGQLLKHIHERVQPVGREIEALREPVCQFLSSNFGLNVKEYEYERSLYRLFPYIRFDQLKEIVVHEGVDFETLPTVENTTLSLVKEFSNEFNLIQLKILASVLRVEEWNMESSFKIKWHNPNPHMKRFVLYYHKKKRILRKKFVYKKVESRKEQKDNVSVVNILNAAERGDVKIIANGFERME